MREMGRMRHKGGEKGKNETCLIRLLELRVQRIDLLDELGLPPRVCGDALLATRRQSLALVPTAWRREGGSLGDGAGRTRGGARRAALDGRELRFEL